MPRSALARRMELMQFVEQHQKYLVAAGAVDDYAS
jgi:hypothetical protein